MEQFIQTVRKRLLASEHLQYVIWHALFEEGYFIEMVARGIDALDANASTVKDTFHMLEEDEGRDK